MTLSYWWACFEHSLPVDAGNIEGIASDEKKDVGEATQEHACCNFRARIDSGLVVGCNQTTVGTGQSVITEMV